MESHLPFMVAACGCYKEGRSGNGAVKVCLGAEISRVPVSQCINSNEKEIGSIRSGTVVKRGRKWNLTFLSWWLLEDATKKEVLAMVLSKCVLVLRCQESLQRDVAIQMKKDQLDPRL